MVALQIEHLILARLGVVLAELGVSNAEVLGKLGDVAIVQLD